MVVIVKKISGWFACFLGQIILVLVLMETSGCASSPENGNTADQHITQLSQANQAYAEGRWVAAEGLYHGLLTVVPNDQFVWFRLGNSQLRQGRIESAIFSLKKAIELDPNDPRSHYNLGIAHVLNALRDMRRAESLMSDSDTGKRKVLQDIEQLQNVIDPPSAP